MPPPTRRFGLFRNAAKTTVYPSGSVIFEEGAEGHTMYAIKRGKVAVMVAGQAVDTLTDEEIFGEMALLEHQARTATVVALEETELVEIDEPQFYLLAARTPTSRCSSCGSSPSASAAPTACTSPRRTATARHLASRKPLTRR